MSFQRYLTKSNVSKAANVLFIGLLLLLLFSPGAKAWLLRQMIAAGLFKPEIKKEAVAVSATTPLLRFRDEQGKTVSTGDLKGKVVFINFWATWCPPCRAEMPSLQELYNQLKDDERIVFLFVNEDEDTAKAKRFLQNKDYTMPLFTREGSFPSAIYSGTLPTTVVLNKDGKPVFQHEGLAAYHSPAFIKQLKALL